MHYNENEYKYKYQYHPPPHHRHTSMMATQAAPPYHHHHHHGSQLLKPQDDSSRTTSPTLVLHPGHPESEVSPVNTSQSTLSTSSPLSYHHHHMAPPSAVFGTRSPMATANASSIPVPVRSASWAAGSPEPLPSSSVPAVITTQYSQESASGAAAPIFRSQPKTLNKSLAAVKKKQTTKKGDKNASGKGGDTVTARRQKRLERNRESARLSRRRRKHYLEVLEERVTQLSLEMDQGRRAHAVAAIQTVLSKRLDLQNVQQPMDPGHSIELLHTSLSRTSEELSVLSTFQMQQLKSFSLPPHSKFILWLTLQGDTYFRGGRAASERLSAARIGERMLQSGNDRVTPLNSMWPLFCNEVGLSYDQEERVRSFQRTLLQDSPTWLERHTARASSLVMQSFHDSVNSVGSSLHQRERTSASSLTPEQRLKFMAWADKNGERLRKRFHTKRQELGKQKESANFQTSSSHHVAANLYILNNRLQKIVAQLPPRVDLVPAGHLKRLLRRPSFESLGQQKDENGQLLIRENSFASSGSLKRSVSSLSMVSENGEEKPPEQVSPGDGEGTAASLIEQELGFVRELIPPIVQPVLPPAPAPVALPPAPQPYHAHHYTQMPVPQQPQLPPQEQYQVMTQHHHHAPPVPAQHVAPQHVASHVQAPVMHQAYQQQYYSAPVQQQTVYAQPVPAPVHQPQFIYSNPIPPTPIAIPHHVRKNSFLPPHLNVVPEEMYPATDASTEDFLMSLIDDSDWAIGEGVDMDTTG